jgi:hypothetical protein
LSVQWRLYADGVAGEWQAAKSLLQGTQCLKKNLQPCAKYEFRIRAKNAKGFSGWSRCTVMHTDGSTSGTPAS